MKKQLLALAIAALFPLSEAYSATVSGAKSRSSLYEPLKAEAVVSLEPGESIVSASLAAPSRFSQKGLEWNPFFTELSVTYSASSDKKGVIHISSRKPVYEPVLNLIIEVKTSEGEVITKQTSVFLDAPYDKGVNLDEPKVGTSLPPAIEKSSIAKLPSDPDMVSSPKGKKGKEPKSASKVETSATLNAPKEKFADESSKSSVNDKSAEKPAEKLVVKEKSAEKPAEKLAVKDKSAEKPAEKLAVKDKSAEKPAEKLAVKDKSKEVQSDSKPVSTETLLDSGKKNEDPFRLDPLPNTSKQSDIFEISSKKEAKDSSKKDKAAKSDSQKDKTLPSVEVKSEVTPPASMGKEISDLPPGKDPFALPEETKPSMDSTGTSSQIPASIPSQPTQETQTLKPSEEPSDKAQNTTIKKERQIKKLRVQTSNEEQNETSLFSQLIGMVPGGFYGIGGIFAILVGAIVGVVAARKRDSAETSSEEGDSSTGSMEFGPSTMADLDAAADGWQKKYDESPGLGMTMTDDSEQEELLVVSSGESEEHASSDIEGLVEESSTEDNEWQNDDNSGLATQLNDSFMSSMDDLVAGLDNEIGSHAPMKNVVNEDLNIIIPDMDPIEPVIPIKQQPVKKEEAVVEDNSMNFSFSEFKFNEEPVASDEPGVIDMSGSNEWEWNLSMDPVSPTPERPPVELSISPDVPEGPARLHLELACLYAGSADWDSYDEAISEVMNEGSKEEKAEALRFKSLTK